MTGNGQTPVSAARKLFYLVAFQFHAVSVPDILANPADIRRVLTGGDTKAGDAISDILIILRPNAYADEHHNHAPKRPIPALGRR